MAVRSLGNLTLDLVLKTGNFMGPMDRAARNTKSRSQEMQTSLLAIGKAVTAVSAVASAGVVGLTAMSKVAAENARQIRNMADVSNATIEEFQRLAYGSKTVGVEGEKLADILKDVNDRIGDFVQTGGGPMADFFENIAPKVGVTADEFQRLSGPEALQLYYDSLEAANLSQKDMTFYLEAMASDVTALVPLLRNGGAGFKEMADEANRVNAVLSTLEVQRLEEVGRQFQQLEQQLTTETARAVSQFDDLMKTSLEGISDGINRLAGGFNLFMDDLRADENKRSLEGINAELGRVFDNKARLEQRIDMFGADAPQAQDSIAALEEVKEQYDALISRRIELAQSSGDAIGVPEVLNLPRLSDNPEDIEKAQKAAERAAKAITDQIISLEQQASTLGFTADEIRLYGLAQDGATDSQLAAASAALKTITAYEASEKSAEDYQSLLADLRTTEEELTAQMSERMAVLDAANVSADEYAEAMEKISAATIQDAPDFSGIDASVAGAGGELIRVAEAEQELQEWHSRQLEMQDELLRTKEINEQTHADRIAEINQKNNDRLASIQDAYKVSTLSMFSDLTGNAADMMGQMAGEGSDAYKALFLVSKAAAIAQTMVSTEVAAAKALELGPIAGIPAASLVRGLGYASVGMIAATTVSGMAHEGIDSIPETGTWLLEKGERVTTAETSAKLDATLARLDRDVNQPNMSGGGGMVIHAPITVESKAGMSAEESRRQGQQMGKAFRIEVLKIMQDEKRQGGLLAK